MKSDTRASFRCCDCGTEKRFYPSEIKGKCARYVLSDGIYRCRSCWNVVRQGKPVKKAVRPTRCCANCTKQIDPKAALCRECYLLMRKKGASFSHSRAISVKCPDCGKIREYKPSHARKLSGYCSSCSRKGTRSGSYKGGSVDLHCASCGITRSVRPSAVKHYTRANGDYYCSACGKQNKPEGPANHAWRGGKSFEPYPLNWTPKLRRAIRERDGHKCAICAKSETSRRMPVHHINYDKSDCSPKNLVTLCSKCHPKTNFRREHWQKFFESQNC